jgi:lipoprotein-releasing system permease protein
MLFLALKQLRARPRQTILTFIAIILGSTGYVVFSGLMLGFQDRKTATPAIWTRTT